MSAADHRALAGTVSGQSFALLHAFPVHATHIERMGSVEWLRVTRRRALCGLRGGEMRSFRIEHVDGELARFDTGASRACPRCVAAIRRGDHLSTEESAR